jgi:hypothetical protein
MKAKPTETMTDAVWKLVSCGLSPVTRNHSDLNGLVSGDKPDDLMPSTAEICEPYGDVGCSDSDNRRSDFHVELILRDRILVIKRYDRQKPPIMFENFTTFSQGRPSFGLQVSRALFG